MIDLHSHILPGLDDGARDMQEALKMAAMAVESGVSAMAVTPHCVHGDARKVFEGWKLLQRQPSKKRTLSKRPRVNPKNPKSRKIPNVQDNNFSDILSKRAAAIATALFLTCQFFILFQYFIYRPTGSHLSVLQQYSFSTQILYLRFIMGNK